MPDPHAAMLDCNTKIARVNLQMDFLNTAEIAFGKADDLGVTIFKTSNPYWEATTEVNEPVLPGVYSQAASKSLVATLWTVFV
jgi:hypothetical protein